MAISPRARRRALTRRLRLRAIAIAEEFGVAGDSEIVKQLHVMVGKNPTPTFQDIAAILGAAHGKALTEYLARTTSTFQLETEESTCGCC